MSSSSSQQEVAPEPGGPLAIWVVAVVVGVYVATTIWMPERGFWIYDTALKFIQVLAIAEHGQLALDWAGRALDPDLDFPPLQWGFHVLVENEIYAAYSPVFAILASPFYNLLGARGLAILPLVGGLLALPAIWRIAGAVAAHRDSVRRVQVLSVLTSAFATPLWFYSMAFWEHAPAVGLSCWCVWACVTYVESPSTKQAAVLGALAGLPIYFRPENYLFAVVVLMFAAWAGRQRMQEVLVMGLSCAVALLPLWIFHTLALGHPLGLHITNQGWSDVTLAGYLAERGQVVTRLLINMHADARWSIAAVAPFYGALALGHRYRARAPRWFVEVACVAGIAAACVIAWGHWNAPRPMNWLIGANGVFAASPFLILAFLRFDLEASEPERRARYTLLWISLVYALLYAAFIPEVNSKGIHWGCRFLLPIFPLLAVLASLAVVKAWERSSATAHFSKATLVVLLGLSVCFQVYSLVMLHDRKAFTAELNARVLDREAGVVVTDLWFVPVDLVDQFFVRPVFYSSGKRRDALLARTDQAGVGTTLFVNSTLRKPAPRGSEVVSDGWLKFSPVSLMERRSAGRILGRGDPQ